MDKLKGITETAGRVQITIQPDLFEPTLFHCIISEQMEACNGGRIVKRSVTIRAKSVTEALARIRSTNQ